nr:hypothetical protein [Tanacetum cinerariifolium]
MLPRQILNQYENRRQNIIQTLHSLRGIPTHQEVNPPTHIPRGVPVIDLDESTSLERHGGNVTQLIYPQKKMPTSLSGVNIFCSMM